MAPFATPEAPGNAARCAAVLDVPAIPVWTKTVAGHAALRACVAADIQPTYFTKAYVQTRDEWWDYEGPEADTVRAVRDAFIERETARMSGDEGRRFLLAQPSVLDAIDAAMGWEVQYDAGLGPGSIPILHAIKTPVRQLDPAAWA